MVRGKSGENGVIRKLAGKARHHAARFPVIDDFAPRKLRLRSEVSHFDAEVTQSIHAKAGALDGRCRRGGPLALPRHLLEACDPKEAPALITRSNAATVVPVGVLGEDHEVSKVRVARIA